MSNNKTLNDILKTYQDIETKLVESMGEVDENLESLLFDNEVELNDKLDGYEKFSRYLKGQVEYLKQMEEHYSHRRKILDKSIKRCKDSMTNALSITNKKNIRTQEFNFSLGKSEKWEIDSTALTDMDKKELIEKGLAENLFKIHLKEIKNVYKEEETEVPEWINIQENLFIRVS